MGSCQPESSSTDKVVKMIADGRADAPSNDIKKRTLDGSLAPQKSSKMTFEIASMMQGNGQTLGRGCGEVLNDTVYLNPWKPLFHWTCL